MFHLTSEERVAATRHVVRIIDGRIPVVATGNFGDTLEDQGDAVKRMHESGVDAVILVTSLLAGQGEPDEVFVANTLRLLELTDKIPLGFYECPLPYKRVLSSAQLRMFVKTGRFIYHKDTCLDILQVREKIAAAKGFSFGLYDAYLGHAVESLRSGSQGLSCIQGNFFPEVIVWLCDNYDNPGLTEEVKTVQQFLVDKMSVMHTAYPFVAKYFLQKRGMNISTFCRDKGGAFGASVTGEIDKLFDDCIALKDALNIQ